eukprot:SAG11_NODE_4331_length_1947_cov_1.258798_1_plen_314_part_00
MVTFLFNLLLDERDRWTTTGMYAMKVFQLKAALRHRGLSIEGTRKELIDRLVEAERRGDGETFQPTSPTELLPEQHESGVAHESGAARQLESLVMRQAIHTHAQRQGQAAAAIQAEWRGRRDSDRHRSAGDDTGASTSTGARCSHDGSGSVNHGSVEHHTVAATRIQACQRMRRHRRFYKLQRKTLAIDQALIEAGGTYQGYDQYRWVWSCDDGHGSENEYRSLQTHHGNIIEELKSSLRSFEDEADLNVISDKLQTLSAVRTSLDGAWERLSATATRICVANAGEFTETIRDLILVIMHLNSTAGRPLASAP